MRIITSTERSFDQGHPSWTADAASQVRSAILADPLGYSAAKAQDVDDSLTGANTGTPIVPRQAQPGNISMHDHLQNRKTAYETDPQGEADAEVGRQEQTIDQVDAELTVEIVWQ